MKRLVCLVLALALAIGCFSIVGAEAPKTRTFVDSCGRSVEVPESIERIAPSGKLAHIVLYALSPEKFVCLSNPWTKDAGQFFPEDILNLPVVGQFYGDGTLNMEELAKAKPDVIIDIGEKKKSVAQDMDQVQAQLGIPTVFIECTTQTTADCYRMLGELLGMPDEAEALASYVDEVYQNTLSTMQQIGEAGKKKVLYCLGEDGMNVLGKGGYHAEILDLMADNLALIDSPSSKAFGDPVDFEQMFAWTPDALILAPDVNMEAIANDPLWYQFDALKNKQVYQVPAGPYNWMGFPPSVNRYMGMIWLGSVLYPDAFNYDLRAEASRYYQLFYHVELSDAQFDQLIGQSIELHQDAP